MNYRLKKIFSLTALILFIFTSCDPGAKAISEKEKIREHKQIVRTVYDMFESGNTGGIEQFVEDDFTEHTPDPAIMKKGREGLKELIRLNHTAFPDLKLTIYRMSGEDDQVFSHFNMSGTNTGSIPGMEASGRSIDIDGVDVVLFKNGKVSEHWGYWDTRKLLEQMGKGK